MSGQRGRGRDGAARRPSGRTASRKPSTGGTPAKPRSAAPAKARAADAVSETAPPPGTFRLGAIAGATPGKWIDIWQERMPRNPLELVSLTPADQRDALRRDEVDTALIRLPIDAADLHVIPLYDELAVVVCARDSHLTAADELTTADLDGEILLTPLDDVIGFTAPGTTAPRFAAPETTEDAIAVVASGVGIVVVPMSLARLYHRKDIDFRPLPDAPTSTVALAWSADRTDPLIDTFVGIVRGRSIRSSR
jgi:DNA-binding transcriptional LysR family regulator